MRQALNPSSRAKATQTGRARSRQLTSQGTIVLLAANPYTIDEHTGARWRGHSGSYGRCTYGRPTNYGAARRSTRDASDTGWSRWSPYASLCALNRP